MSDHPKDPQTKLDLYIEQQLVAQGKKPTPKAQGFTKAGDIIQRSATVKASTKITPHVMKLLNLAEEIRTDPDAAEAAFMARQLVQCTLPHTNPGNVPVWARTNGNLTLGIQQGYDLKSGKPIGYPYGSIPRLLLFWITTEAVQTKNRRLELGKSLSAFMRDIGLDPNTGRGKRGDAPRLREQMRRLFAAHISFEQVLEENDRHGQRWLHMHVAPKGELWWDPKQPLQDNLWGSWIELGEDFFTAITNSPVPVDIRALRALKRSPLALDLYAWAIWRAFTVTKKGKAQFVPWAGLMTQLGTDYAARKDFRRKAKDALKKVQAVYPGLSLSYESGGVSIHPSRPAISPRTSR
jgi:hypothetical protein